MAGINTQQISGLLRFNAGLKKTLLHQFHYRRLKPAFDQTKRTRLFRISIRFVNKNDAFRIRKLQY